MIAYGGYEYCSDGAEEKFFQMREEFNGLNGNKECLVRYWGKNFLILSTKIDVK